MSSQETVLVYEWKKPVRHPLLDLNPRVTVLDPIESKVSQSPA